MNGDSMEGFSKDLPYDLRQIYAVEILGEHLKDVARARKANNFPMYFECLKDVWIVSQHKFKNKEITIKQEGKTNKISVEEYYNLLMEKVAELANKYKNEWFGQSKNPQNIAKISESLNKVEMFLYDKIEEAKMFGSSKTIPGL